MNYADGKSVMLGDKVDLGAGVRGVVVAVIDSNEFASGYKGDEWQYLRVGALVESEEAGLTHYPNADGDFKQVERGCYPRCRCKISCPAPVSAHLGVQGPAPQLCLLEIGR